jgi:hypothetical protein
MTGELPRLCGTEQWLGKDRRTGTLPCEFRAKTLLSI